MVDEDKTFTPDTELDSAPADSGDSGAETALKGKKRGAGAWLGYGALALVLILVAAGVFLLHELRSQQESLGSGLDKGDKRVLDMQTRISTLEADIQTVRQQLVNVQTEASTEKHDFEREISQEDVALKSQIEALRVELSSSIQHIQRHMNQTKGDIKVADAEYLLSVANQKLHLVGDVKAVLAMMEAADQMLLESGDPATFKVREALVAEINLLKGFSAPDIVGVSAQLLVLEDKVKELPLFLPHSGQPAENHQPVAGGPDQAAAKKDLLDDLKGLVTIRRMDKPVDIVLSPEEVAILRQVLLLKLEMSRSALLRGDDALFKANVESAASWLTAHFDREAAAVQGLAEDLKKLQELQLHVPLPDISKSLGLLRNIEKLRLDADKSSGGKQEKPEKPSGQPAAPEPAPQPTAPPALNNLPAAEPLPEEAKP